MNITYCLECAAPLSKESETRYVCVNGHKYYNNSNTGCILIFMNPQHEVLYSQRARDPHKGKFDFPGGFLNYGEDPYKAAVREAKEEMNLELDVRNLLLIEATYAMYDINDAVCDFVFLCRDWQGIPVAADDVAALAWKPIEFMLSPEFAWPFPYLYNRLHAIARNHL